MRQSRFTAWLSPALLVAIVVPCALGADEVAKPGTFEAKVAPVLNKYCISCHGGKKPKAGVNLATFTDEAAVLKDLKTWEKVLENVELGLMPPEDKPQPTEVEVETLTAWVESTLTSANCRGPADPGRVTLRRLNRNEYNNTIRDLVGIDFHPADDFPSDDVGYGFDNIGDVLSLPPLLMERYLAAAEQIVQRAIIADERLDPLTRRRELERFGKNPREQAAGQPYKGFARGLASNGEIVLEFQPSREGNYQVRVRAFGQQAGPDPARLTVRVDGKDIETVDVTATEDAPGTYDVLIPLTPGRRKIALAFVNDYYKPDDSDPKLRGDRNLYLDWVEFRGPIADLKSLPEPHRRIVFLQPSSKKSEWRGNARIILERFASRAYRRPATPEELDRLLTLFDMALKDGERFERGIQLAVEAVLVSPHFLFRVEYDDDEAAHPLNDYELAARLSYFLWSSMPDEELFTLAAEHKLQNNDVLDAQVRRMLNDPKASALVENFAGQWLQIRNLKTLNPDPGQFPNFDEALRSAMIRETELFFQAILTEDRSLLDFLDADFTFLNERLAKHYGIKGVRGEEFRRVPLTDPRRGGILTQASILTITSNPTRTSPVKRGKWILEQVLGAPPPPPPPDVPELLEGKDARLSGSLRQRMEQHRVDPGCASCHVRMDPLGFGFENFDPIGAWREQDEGLPIDPSGVLPSGQTFQGPAELKAILKTKDAEFARCLAEKMLTYALGRGLEYPDKCAVDRITATLSSDQYRLTRLVREIVKSDPFRKRKGKGDES
ncbi:MAG: DUF1592 domain-containing protein [Isosphaeraceae bacterium]